MTTMQQMTGSIPEGASKAASGMGRLRPRARLLNSIGAELISSEIVAVIELVRNSYDADSKEVEIVFTGLRGEGEATVEIRDDGHGMSREVLLGPWMEPATDFKSEKGRGHQAGTRSPRGRRRLGSKGVGRFASQRLGSHLTLSTRTPNSETELSARFDWTEIERPDRYLDEMQIPWEERAPEQLGGPGTILRISGLRDEWTPDRFEKLRVALARLVSPDHDGDTFKIELVIGGYRERVRSIIDRNQAMYSLRGTVDGSGHAHIVYGDLQGNEETWERAVLWPTEEGKNCGPFSFRLSAWDLDREPLLHYLKEIESPLGLRDFRRSLRDHSGVSLYRDGFRTLPYGEPDNDWLRLDRRRINNPTLRLSNNQILGFVSLTADDNPGLRDQTNREGLVANAAYEHLREVVCELLGYLENRRFAARRANEMGIDRGSSKLPELTADVDRRIDTLLAEMKAGGAQRDLGALKEALDERRQAEAETIRLYSGLATTGQLAGMLFAQVGHSMLQFESELRSLELEVTRHKLEEEDLPEGFVEDLAWSMQRLKTLARETRAKLEKVDPLVQPGRGRRLRDATLEECVQVVLDAFADQFAESQISVEVVGDKEATVKTNVSVVQQALAAVLDNALHWTATKPKTRSEEARLVRICFEAGAIVVANNGPSISEEDRPHLFEAHFTRRPGAAGLGLALASDLLRSIGATIVHRQTATGPSFVISMA